MSKDLIVKSKNEVATLADTPNMVLAHHKHAIPEVRMAGWTLTGFAITIGLVGGIVGWALATPIDGAVIAPGSVAVESKRKNVQHLEGGIVAEVPVKDGDYVKAGDMVVRLDDTQARSELTAARDQLIGLHARQARLRTELRGESTITFPQNIVERKNETRIVEIIENEKDLHASKTAALRATTDLLKKRIGSFEARIDGFKRRKINSIAEKELLQEQLQNLQSLLERNLVEGARVLDIRRSIGRVEQEITAGEAEADSLAAQIRENQAQVRQVISQARADAADDMAEVQTEIGALAERILILEDRLKRGIVVAPQSGRVLNLAVAAPGAVVQAGETIMEIVPIDDELVLLARVPTNDVERIRAGQNAKVRLTAFNLNSTPELDGRVESVSADVLTEEETGVNYYSAKIILTNTEALAQKGEELVPGMPAEVLVSTGERLAAFYLIKPLMDAYARSFKDE